MSILDRLFPKKVYFLTIKAKKEELEKIEKDLNTRLPQYEFVVSPFDLDIKPLEESEWKKQNKKI